MTKQEDNEKQLEGQQKQTPASPESSGDPGRTPGTAEGDEQTVDESLNQKS